MALGERWASSRAGRIVAGLLCLLMIAWLGGKMGRAVQKAGAEHANDYEAFLIGGRAMLRGQNLYEVRTGENRHGYTLAPWFALVMAPFELMGYRAAAFAWPLLNLAALAASSYWCLRVARGAGRPIPWPACVVPILALGRALDSNFAQGQVNALIVALVSLGLWLYVRKRDVWAGAALAAATLTKPMPALLIAYFAWKREWRVFAGAVGGLLILSLVAPMPAYGLAGGYRATRDWVQKRVLAFADEVSEDGYVPGQSLRPLVYRLLTRSQAAPHSEEVVRVNVASLSPRAAEAVYKLGALLLVVVLGVASWGRGDRSQVERTAAELALAVSVMLVVSPFARKAHFLHLLLPMAFVYSRLALLEAWTWRERVLLGCAVACVAAVGLSGGRITGGLSTYLTALACMSWGALALAAGLLVTLRGLRTPAPPSGEPGPSALPKVPIPSGG